MRFPAIIQKTTRARELIKILRIKTYRKKVELIQIREKAKMEEAPKKAKLEEVPENAKLVPKVEYKRYLGDWTIDNKKVEVYECRYKQKNHIKISLFYKSENPNEQGKELGCLSANLNSTSLEPGEFCVQNYGDMKEFVKQMENFPEFEETEKRAVIRNDDPGAVNLSCPIWRLRSYDCYRVDSELDISVREGGMITNSTAECTFGEVKRMVKKVPTNREIAEHLVMMDSFEDTFIVECINEVVENIVRNF